MKRLTCLRFLIYEVSKELGGSLGGDLKLETKEYLNMLIKNILKEEQIHYLVVARYERDKDRADFRNDYCARDIELSLELIKDIKFPRNRITSHESILFKKYKRKEISLIQLIKDVFLSGLSIRKPGDILENILAYKVSAQTVSNIAKSLDGLARAYYNKNIEDKYKYLFLS